MKRIYFLLIFAIISQVCMPVLASNNSEAAPDVLTYYYLNHQSDKVPSELEKFITSETFLKDENFRK